jgi:hypothetical protein
MCEGCPVGRFRDLIRSLHRRARHGLALLTHVAGRPARLSERAARLPRPCAFGGRGGRPGRAASLPTDPAQARAPDDGWVRGASGSPRARRRGAIHGRGGGRIQKPLVGGAL